MDMKWTDTGNYKDAAKFSLVYQLILLLFTGMILDGGRCSGYVTMAMIAFWGSVIVLIIRNPKNPKPVDIVYIKFGFIPVLIITPYIMGFVWSFSGF